MAAKIPTGHASSGGAPATVPTGALGQMCGSDSRDIAGLPLDQIQQKMHLTAAQSTALDALADASAMAAQKIKDACPMDVALTAPSRLAHMQQRISAMIAAVATVQPALDRFYGLLTDEQKQLLTALGQDQVRTQGGTKGGAAVAQTCGAAEAGATPWPTAEIDRAVRPTEAQRAELATLEDDTAKAADMLKASCRVDDALTPPARLAAVGMRLDAMLQAVKTVREGLDAFYGSLNDEQKAKFEAIGPQRTSALDHPRVRQVHYRGRSIEGGVESLIRSLLPF